MAETNKKPGEKQKRFTPAFTVPEAAGWLGVLVFVCAWFFVLGILVGRGIVPVAQTEKDAVTHYLQKKRAKSLEQKAGETGTRRLELGYREALNKDTSSESEAAPSGNSNTPVMKTPKTEKPSNPPDLSDAHAEDDADKVFTIQVAAVRDEASAASLVSRLKKKGFSVYTTSVELSGGNLWYRLRCGEYASRKEAGPVINELKDEGFDPILVRR